METPSTQSIIRQASQSIDDSNLTGSGSRRPGNVWSTEAREDLFRRRELGEGWETLCADYPDRSRHAMQQQYSMMKKQIAVANGTYNPKPRKRRSRKVQTSKDTWNSVTKKQLDLDDGAVGEEDDDEDLTMDESDDDVDEHAFGTPDSPGLNGTRPSIPLRSATDPVSRVQPSKIVKFPNLPKSTGTAGFRPTPFLPNAPPELSRASTDAEWSERETTTTMNPNKRRKTSPDHYNAKLKAMAPDSPNIFQPFPGFMLNHDQVVQLQSILQCGEEMSRNTSMAYEAEKASLKRMYDAMVERANQRAHVANENFRENLREHAEDMKHKDIQHAEVVTALKKELERAKKLRETETSLLENERRLRQNEQAELTAKANMHAGEIELLNNEVRALNNRIATVTATTDSQMGVADTKHAIESAEEKLVQASQLLSAKDDQLKRQSERLHVQERSLADKDELLWKQEQQLMLSNQQRGGMGKGVFALQEKTTAAKNSLAYVNSVRDKLTSSIRTFAELDLDDTGTKTIKKHVQAIKEAKEIFDQSLDSAQESTLAVSEFMESFVQAWGNEVPTTNGTNGHSEVEQGKA